MAEVALLLVIKKIGIAVAGETLKFAKPLLAKKAALVAALPDDMNLVKNELELINAFLQDNGRNGSKDKVRETWIQQVRKLAYDMEDIADQFIYIVGKHNQKGSWWNYVKKIVKKPQSLFSLDEVATAVKRINQELKQIKENKDCWAKSIDGTGSDIPAANYESQQLLYVPGHDYSIKDDELVGIDKNRETLLQALDSEGRHLRIISLWGMGGIGKSTLVNNVYRNEVSNFPCRAWASVSQSYKMDDIWRKMLREFDKDKREYDVEKMNNIEIRANLKKILNEKRYLIILDDVWKAEDYRKITEVIDDNGLGSRVIITTRIEEVATLAEHGCKIKVEPLNDHDAWLLFCRKAFPKIENHICPPELSQCGLEIVEKCGGLPLALVAIGSILSLKSKSDKEWRLFNDRLTWELQNNEDLNRVEKILNLSYKYLPSYLKNCFLYCAMFPEDYLIRRKRLIKLWIAEGFIEKKGACTVEDVAEGYLTELVRRSMLHVVEGNSFDRIARLRMHDLVRELAIFQSKRESFSTIYDDTHGMVQVGLDSRRVSVFQCTNDIRSSIDPSRLRTFIAFDTSMASSSWTSFIPSESKYLAVLDLSGLPIETIPNSIGQLFNLKYLCLNDTNVKELPNSITKLLNLETLSIQRTQFLNFRRGFADLKKLRHLLVWKWLDATYRSFNYAEGMDPVEGLWNLKELQSLNDVRATKVFVAKLGCLSQLRSLCISDVKNSHCAQLCNSLSNMHQLARLQITASNEHELLSLEDLTLPKPLEKLELIGRLSEGTLKSPFLSTHGNQLLLMDLSWCQLAETPLPRLSELSNLTSLSLRRAYTGTQLNFHAGYFRNLKKVYLWDMPHVNQICIHEGALVSLVCLSLLRLEELRDIPVGIEFLKSVKEANFTEMHPDFVGNFRKAKLDHIPKVFCST